jgi:ribose/xylose/arabinose/galactoside ABC-type transport system permease subunit
MILRGLRGALRPWLVLALVCGGFSLHSGFRSTFWTAEFLKTIPQQAATNIVLAVGMTLVILTGGIDLSVGSVLALCSIALGMTVTTGPAPFLTWLMAAPLGAAVALLVFRQIRADDRIRIGISAGAAAVVGLVVAKVIQSTTSGGIQLEGAIIAALAVGCGCGVINGAIVTQGRVPPFVATLGMYTAARGLAVYATGGKSVSGLPLRLGQLGFGVPLLVVTFATVVLGAILLGRLRAGRYLFAIGGNEEAARLTGVDVKGYKALAYLLSGLCAGIAAVLLTAKFLVADTGAGSGAELNAIAAVVIGGTSLSGGRGSVVGSLVGALTIAVLNAALVLTGVPDTLQGLVIGSVIVAAVLIDQIGQRK